MENFKPPGNGKGRSRHASASDPKPRKITNQSYKLSGLLITAQKDVSKHVRRLKFVVRILTKLECPLRTVFWKILQKRSAIETEIDRIEGGTDDR
jgi:hypothetical protein